ncbi:hypothetical protein [Falsiroseomonas sp. CW058]|uniref:hypothetical protein n=1 Tax=Falsiroseomonas sp. CW058 TaxID=3388664 RepID=UPI003D311365
MTKAWPPLVLSFLWLLSFTTAPAAEQLIATHGSLTASVAGSASCGANARLTVRAPDEGAFSGDRIELQRLLGVARSAMEADCPALRQIDVSGLANGRPAFQGTLTAANGWRLAAAGPRAPPPSETRPSAPANAVPCEHDPTNPLIGCWLRVIPAEPGPAIAIFTRAGRLLGGTPAEITSPQVWGANFWRSRMVGFGHIIEYVNDQGSRGQFNPPVFHEQCSVMELQGRGFFSFLAQDNPNDYRLYVRLNVRRITRDVLSDEAEIERIGQLLSQDIDSDECRDPYQSTFESDSVFRALMAVTPALGLAGRTRLLQPRLSRGFSQRHGIASRPPVTSTASRVASARQRQATMLQNNVGYNVSPRSTDAFQTIGRDGTYVTDRKAIEDILGPLSRSRSNVISRADARRLEGALGLTPGSLDDGFKIRRINSINSRSPRSPNDGMGNENFLGGGRHLPGGGPEMIIDGVPTRDGNGVSTILDVTVR